MKSNRKWKNCQHFLEEKGTHFEENSIKEVVKQIKFGVINEKRMPDRPPSRHGLDWMPWLKPSICFYSGYKSVHANTYDSKPKNN